MPKTKSISFAPPKEEPIECTACGTQSKSTRQEDKDWLEQYEIKYSEQLKQCFEPRITQLVRLRCRDWMDLAMLLTKKYGKEGLELARASRWATAKPYADLVKKNYGTGVIDILRSYNEYLPWWKPIWDLSIGEVVENKKMRLRMKCQVGEYWKERIAEGTATRELARIWCEWDSRVPELVNPKIKYSLNKWIPDGSCYCEHIWELKK